MRCDNGIRIPLCIGFHCCNFCTFSMVFYAFSLHFPHSFRENSLDFIAFCTTQFSCSFIVPRLVMRRIRERKIDVYKVLKRSVHTEGVVRLYCASKLATHKTKFQTIHLVNRNEKLHTFIWLAATFISCVSCFLSLLFGLSKRHYFSIYCLRYILIRFALHGLSMRCERWHLIRLISISMRDHEWSHR